MAEALTCVTAQLHLGLGQITINMTDHSLRSVHKPPHI